MYVAGIVALLLYLMTLKGQLTRMAKGLLCAAGVLTLLALWRSPTPGQLLFEASGRFAFFATFIVALSMLRLPAYRSRLVRHCGQSMLLQPPSRRYPILSLGSALFGIILNIGVLNLFAAMIEKVLLADQLQHEVFLLSALDSTHADSTEEVIARYYPDVELRYEGLQGFAPFVTMQKARRLLGFEPQYSWRNNG